MAVLFPWIVLILLVIFPEPHCHPLIYKYAIKTPLFISIIIFTITIAGRWFAIGFSNLITKQLSKILLKQADDDLKKLNDYGNDDMDHNCPVKI